MSEYSDILQSALDASLADTSRLSEKIGDVCVKTELDHIINNGRSWAPLKATVVSIAAKLKYPEWDTRKHQTQLGGMFSLRTHDRCFVSDFLFKNGLYDTATEFALTRSFEKAEPFMKTYTGNITPKVCKSAFLNLVDIINTSATPELLTDMLVYLMGFLKERKMKNTTLKESVIESSKELTLEHVTHVLDSIHSLGSGISVVPVIVVHTLLSVLQPHMFPSVSIKPLKEHTAPDGHTHSYGDVEAFDADSCPVIAIEVKHNIDISESIVETFDKKTREQKIPIKTILTTKKKTSAQFKKNNIRIDSVTCFTVVYLQQALMFDPSICSNFIKELRTRIVSYTNISVGAKESINSLLTSLLDESSP